MLEIALERAGGAPLDLRTGSADALPVDDASCDVVLAFDSMDHWADVPAGLREVQRVLRPGGQFVVVKDQDAPSDSDFTAALTTAGFTVVDDQTIAEEDVRFRIWTTRYEPRPAV